MGSSQSVLTPEVAVAGAVVVGTVSAAAYGFYSRSSSSGTASGSAESGTSAISKKKKKSAADKEKAREDAEFDKALAAVSKAKAPAQVVPFPAVVPGTFDSDAAAAMLAPSPQKPSVKRAKKKKAKKVGVVGDDEQDEDSQAEPAAPSAPISETTPTPELPTATGSKKKKRKGVKGGAAADGGSVPASKNAISSATGSGGASRVQGLAESYVLSDAPDDSSWTRVTSRRRGAGATETDLLTSDTNATQTSTTQENTEDDGEEEDDEDEGKPADTPRKPLAERLLPRARKTGVEE